jgi:hypothetical protein
VETSIINTMNSANNNNTMATESKARCKLAWILNDMFVPFNFCCMDDDATDLARRVLKICETHPNLALEHYVVEDTGEKVTALEAFLRNRIEPKVIQEFCAKFPEALQVKSNAGGLYPLHTACEEVPPGDGHILIPFLAERFPEAVWTRDSEGNLPIHKVLRRLAKCPAACHQALEVEALVRLFPESTITKGLDLAGEDPIHFVLSRAFNPAVIKSVVTRIPETVGLDYITELLSVVQLNGTLKRKDQEKTSISYGLLREAPSLWACSVLC